ncbi:hypothetical protein Tco_0330298, partial [Tanacetum coccineum]
MYYPRFTKAIIHYFISKDKSILYRAILPEGMTNQQMCNSPAYKTYLAFATGAATPKKARKFRQSASVQIRDTPGMSVSNKKAPVKAERRKGIELLSEAASLEEAQLKKSIKR